MRFSLPTALVATASLIGLLAASLAAAPIDSVYSPLVGKDCGIVENGIERAYATFECPGIADFRLRVLRDDGRASVTVVTPGGKQFPLEYWNVVTRAFSDLGPTAEWRVTRTQGKATPIALIVRVNADEAGDAGAPPRRRSLLAVAKITPEVICVVRTIDAAPAANRDARALADAAAAEPCLQPLP